MKIFLCYSYRANTTAVYFDRALRRDHDVTYVGDGYGTRPGYPPNVDLCDLIAAGVEEPDFVLFIEPGMRFFPRGLEAMSCPTACYLIDVHQSLWVRERYAPFFDYLFVAQRDYVEHFKKLGYPRVEWLPLACDEVIHIGQTAEELYDIGFVGNPGKGVRRRRLELLAREFTMNDWWVPRPKEEIAEVYSRSRLIFNSSINGDLNMRVFEALASGKPLITDRIANGQSQLFQDGVHLAEYGDDVELLRQIRHYLGDPARREAVGRAGRAEVLAKHTYEHRAKTILATVFSPEGPVLGARSRTMDASTLRPAYAEVYSMMRIVDPILDELATALAARQWKTSCKLLFVASKAILRRANSMLGLTTWLRRMLHRSPRQTPLAGSQLVAAHETKGDARDCAPVTR